MENGLCSPILMHHTNRKAMKKDFLSKDGGKGSPQILTNGGAFMNKYGRDQEETYINGCPETPVSINPEIRLLRLTSSESFRQRKLILHFDVRNTILVADSKWSVNVEQALNVYLSGVTWGRETEDGGWEWVSDEPRLTAPVPDAMTYYRHVERKTVSSPNDRALLRKLTGNFTQEPIGRRFIPHFKHLLKLLEWPHELKDELLTMYGKDRSLYHYLIPAFLRLIEVLARKRRRFAIIIRTYGMDGPQVLKAIESTAKGNHPSFPNPIGVQVNKRPGKVVRNKEKKIQFEKTMEEGLLVPKSEVFGTEKAIYKMLSESEGVSGFVDHFQHWADNNFDYKSGKPLWVDEFELNPDVHHIFFDDNLRVMDTDSIVNARTFVDPSRSSGRAMTLEEAAKYEDACLVQANLLESIENIDYFLEKIDMCEANYESILEERRSSHSGT